MRINQTKQQHQQNQARNYIEILHATNVRFFSIIKQILRNEKKKKRKKEKREKERKKEREKERKILHS